jgi:hypothetical protein
MSQYVKQQTQSYYKSIIHNFEIITYTLLFICNISDEIYANRLFLMHAIFYCIFKISKNLLLPPLLNYAIDIFLN